MPGTPILAAQLQVIRKLQQRGAFSAETARQLTGLSFFERGRLAGLIRAAVVREPAPGVYFIDRVALGQYRKRQLFLSVGLVLVVLAAVLVAAIWL